LDSFISKTAVRHIFYSAPSVVTSMKSLEDAEADIISVINERQEITYNELRSFASAIEIQEELLKRSLKELESAHAIASRSSGGLLMYYILQDKPLFSRIMIVEDDKDINKLMALSIGKGFDITQIYDGSEALERIKYEKPDLVVLDLMLPGLDGLEICQNIKRDQNLHDTIVIIVSAMDATTNRFKGIKYGADYYIKKPFDPDELRSLVTVFLRKKGKKLDPLIDLPNEDRISEAVERALKETQSSYEIGKLRVEGLANFAAKFGNQSGITILRLVSQLLQDKVKESKSNAFVGFLDSDDFVIAGDRTKVEKIIGTISAEFSAVLPFIYQSEGYKPIELGIEDIYGADMPRMNLSYTAIRKDYVMERRAEVLEKKEKEGAKDLGSYTYEELRHMLGGDNLDITITRDPEGGLRLSAGKSGNPKKKDERKDPL
jgi:DNA-binding response OmpR family regulator